jgi:hypothetical protein
MPRFLLCDSFNPEVIGERVARHMLCDEAARLQHTDLPVATDCAALADRIDALVRPA